MEQTASQRSTDQPRIYKFRLRIPLTALAAILFLALTFDPTPSDTAPTDPNLRPHLDDAAQTQEIEHFLTAGTGASDGRFHPFHSSDLEAAVNSAQISPVRASLAQVSTSARHRLSLLDPGPDVEERRRFLHQIPYGTVIALAAERNHVDGLLLAAMVSVESGFSPRAVSPQGARGLMQVIPDVASDFGIKGDLLDPYVNMEVGSRFVGGLIKDYKGDLERALAAYNAGPGVVDRYKGVPPYSETRGYVRQVLAQYAEYHRKAGSRPAFPAAPKVAHSEAFRVESSTPARSELSR